MVPMVAFASAIKIPASIALPKPLTLTPGKKYAASATATPINKTSMISLIIKV